jgi:ketosteroid isomerase-like protein
VSRGVDTLRRLYELFAAGDYDAASDLVNPEIDWDTSAAPGGVRVTGAEAAMGDYESMRAAWDEYELVTEDVVEVGDHVVVVVRNRGRGAGGGVPIEARRAHMWRLREGRPVAFRLYLDPEEALAAVGVEPPA